MWTVFLVGIQIAQLLTLVGLLAKHRSLSEKIAYLAVQKSLLDAMFVESITPDRLKYLPERLVRLCNDLRVKYRDVITAIERGKPLSREQRDFERNQGCIGEASIAQCDRAARPSDSLDTECALEPRGKVIQFPATGRLPN